MKTWNFKGLLQQNGWIENVYVSVDNKGLIKDISTAKPDHQNIEKVDGFAIPGFQNAHSHAFQFAMAGLAEVHPEPSSHDDFWSWRETMYEIALSISPEQLESVAAMLYMEMLKHGYTSVAEFHYLHHDKNGNPYSNHAEMSMRLMSAASEVGMDITIVPIFYQKGGFGNSPRTDQRRFISATSDDYFWLLESCKTAATSFQNARVGTGIHSLRAVSEEDIKFTFDNHGEMPLHIHIAEQLKEVEDCMNFYGMRPVQWLLNNVNVNDQTHLVHATHLSKEEMEWTAGSGAHVVLCPSTEGNLGDGLFPLKNYQDLNGNWSIGTDSHIGLNPLEELRILDYGQRLTTHRRNNFVSDQCGNTGEYALRKALISGRKAMGNHSNDYFVVGQPFNAVIIDANQVLIATSSMDYILPTLIYSGDCTFFSGTITNGTWVVKNLSHQLKHEVESGFINAIKSLNIR